MHVMLKVKQEGERLNKVLNDLESKLVHIKDKPTRYFQMIRDLENREFSDKTCFQSKKRKRQIALM